MAGGIRLPGRLRDLEKWDGGTPAKHEDEWIALEGGSWEAGEYAHIRREHLVFVADVSASRFARHAVGSQCHFGWPLRQRYRVGGCVCAVVHVGVHVSVRVSARMHEGVSDEVRVCESACMCAPATSLVRAQRQGDSLTPLRPWRVGGGTVGK